MSKIIIIFLLITTSCFAQLELRNNPYLKGEIILIDGNVKNGLVKLNGSAFSVEFKENENQRKPDKIDYKSINKIVINSELSGRREFYYKKTDADKFYKFVELIYSNNLEVYVYSPDNLSLFYSDVDRSNVADWLSYERSESSRIKAEANRLNDLKNGNNAANYLNNTKPINYSKIKENLAKGKNIKYLLHKKYSEKLNFIYSDKKLNEYAVENFKDCPELILKIENKVLVLDDIFEIVDLYNNCKI
ncbi:hypothetical protein [Flavobacterium sp. GSA192]|uniref:hypothetical protein n=1 Tax=Flavobacterium sp. GSA192 TaxID=2576304 RepID=UPI0011293806|nr:hypothetical protein [Flavobacterium sp. GSA192]